jgi:hypothetical protein
MIEGAMGNPLEKHIFVQGLLIGGHLQTGIPELPGTADTTAARNPENLYTMRTTNSFLDH